MKVDWEIHDAWIMTADGWEQLDMPEDGYEVFLSRSGPVDDYPAAFPGGLYFEGYDEDQIAEFLRERFEITAETALKWARRL